MTMTIVQAGRAVSRTVSRAASLAVSALCAIGLSSPATAAPPTPIHDVVDTYHGTQVHDPYRWLEDGNAPAVKQWIDAQNAHTDAVMSTFKDSAAIIKRVGALALTSTQRSDPQIAGGMLFYLRQTPPQPQAVLVAEGWPKGQPKVLVDTNAANGNVAITRYWPSPDGKLVAYGTGRDDGVLRPGARSRPGTGRKVRRSPRASQITKSAIRE